MSKINILFTDRKKIRKSWSKSDEDVKADIDIIKNWIITQKHLPEIPEDNVIEFFLTNCKYSIEKTKQNLDMYYTARDVLQDIYKDIHPLKSKYVPIVHKTAYFVSLPKLTPELSRVTVIQFKETEAEQTNVLKTMAYVVNNMYEIRMHEDLTLGEIAIVDLKHIKLSDMAKLTPTFLKQFATVLEKVQSNRMKALHLLHPPTFVDMIISIFKSFLSKKLQDRIKIHNSIEDLYNYIPQETLPSDYGGKEKSLDELTELWNKKMMEYEARFDILETLHVKEELRPKKLENDEILGYHGNFKKINVD